MSAARRSRSRAKRVKHAFGFLDETGTLGSSRDPFFAVGLLRCREPYDLLRPMQRIRDKQHFYDEVKWSKVSAKKLPLPKALLDVFLSSDAKVQLLDYLKEQAGVTSFVGGHKDGRLNVQDYLSSTGRRNSL